jgi:hypothetical protein
MAPVGTAARSRGRALVPKIALALAALLLPLLALEVALRLFGPILPGFYRTGTDLVAHPIFGHFHQPNVVVWRRTPEFVAAERINSKGLRDRELPYEKPAGAQRLLVLGDSYVEADQVDAREMLTTRLEALIGGRTEVINAGVGGFGTAQEWLFFREEGYRYQPDVVLVVFFIGNDVRNNSARLDNDARLLTEPYFGLAADGSLTPVDASSKVKPRAEGPFDGIKRGLRASVLYNVFETGVLEKLGQDDESEDVYTWSKNEEVYQARYSRDWEDAWAVTRALLAALKSDLEARGARLVLVAAPSDLQVRPDDWERLLRSKRLQARDFDLEKPNRLLAEIAGKLGVPLVDLLPKFRRAEAESRSGLFFRQNRHWTPDGHAVAARVIHAELTRLGLAPVGR